MAMPDLVAPAPLSLCFAARPPFARVGLFLPAFLIFSCAAWGAAQCPAQDVAEAAKQERARKETQQKKPQHVYTEEDLKRAQILTSEDRAQLEAARNQPAPPATEKSQSAADGSVGAREVDNRTVAPQIEATSVGMDLDSLGATPSLAPQPLPADAPLGDVARRFRQLKLSQDLQRSAEFHLPFAKAPVLASPQPSRQPLTAPLPVMQPAPTSHDFNTASPSPVLQASSPRLAPSPPSRQPRRPSLPVLKAAHPRYAPSQPLVKRSPFSRPPAAVFGPPRINPSRPLATPAAPTSSAVCRKLNVVTVQPGESLWSIAEHHLGQGLLWHDLLAVNPGILNPDHIAVGRQLYLPAAACALRAATKLTVRQGDTLSQIAQSHFGHASYAACIARANSSIRDASRIYAGQSLLLPATCKP